MSSPVRTLCCWWISGASPTLRHRASPAQGHCGSRTKRTTLWTAACRDSWHALPEQELLDPPTAPSVRSSGKFPVNNRKEFPGHELIRPELRHEAGANWNHHQQLETKIPG